MHIPVRAVFHRCAAFMVAWAFLGAAAFAQKPSFAAFKAGSMAPAPAMSPVTAPLPQRSERHKFWDRKNCFLFATEAAFSAADFVVTKDNLQNGGRELNPVTRVFGTSTPGLAANFAGQTAGAIGISYLFHKTGHHKLERIVSMLNAGGSAAAVSFDLAHR
ncbi:MAG TPA: hypothetical protein VMU61_01970 [Candidatus Aquilonibacter sp.]|nr:hypothetical protein [Candidatus Aquilonibacter sp.]